jgi:cytoskeleton-associated protein 5
MLLWQVEAKNSTDIVATGENKVPKVRQDTLDWVTRSLLKSTNAAKRASVVKVVKPLANFLLTTLDDGSPDVRESAAKAFGNLVGIVGERTMTPYLSKLDKIKAAKVKEHIPEGAAAPPPVAMQAASVEDNLPSGLVLKPGGKKEEEDEEEKPAPKKAPAKAATKATKSAVSKPTEDKKPVAKAVPAKKTTGAAPAKPGDKKKAKGKNLLRL